MNEINMMSLMKCLFFMFALLQSNLMACASPATAFNADQLQQDLQRMLLEERLAGAVIATVMPDSTKVHAIGYFDATKKSVMPPDAKVHVGSVTKTMLALSLLHLASEGRVSLDDAVQSWLPGIRFINPWEKSATVRIRHLLDHTAGLEDARLRHIFSAKTSPDTPLSEAFLPDVSVLRIRTEPGKHYSYSNLGYTLAGMVIEAVVKERYETWADREVVQKIGMRDSTFGFTTQVGSGADRRLAWGHVDGLKPVAAQAVAVRPGAQFTTTAADMAQLARFLMGNGEVNGENNGENNGKPFIQKSWLQAMGRASTTEAAQAGLQVGYGLGLATRDRYGVSGLCHGGSTVGFRAMFCIYPARQRAFFIAYNTDSETARHGRFEERIVQALGLAQPSGLGKPVDLVSGLVANMPLSQDWRGRYIPEPSRFEMAKLADVLGSSVYLEPGKTHTLLKSAWAEPHKLVRVGEQLLQREDRSTASHALLQDGQGRRYLTDHNGTLRRIDALWYAAIWLSVGLGLAGLLYWILALPVRRIRQGQSLRQPAALAMLLLLLPMTLFPLQSWSVLGDLTLASGALYVGTLALPCLMVLQLGWTFRQNGRPLVSLRTRQCDRVAAVLVLQFCGFLFAWDVLPLAMWR